MPETMLIWFGKNTALGIVAINAATTWLDLYYSTVSSKIPVDKNVSGWR